MHNEFVAIIERDADWYIAYCLEIPGANGQGRSKEESHYRTWLKPSLLSSRTDEKKDCGECQNRLLEKP